MNPALVHHPGTDVGAPPARAGLASETPLRVAAATLSNSAPGDISATTVVGIVGADDVAALQGLVDEIAHELDLHASVRIHVGSFSVRFARVA
jgi:hypothetical protein